MRDLSLELPPGMSPSQRRRLQQLIARHQRIRTYLLWCGASGLGGLDGCLTDRRAQRLRLLMRDLTPSHTPTECSLRLLMQNVDGDVGGAILAARLAELWGVVREHTA